MLAMEQPLLCFHPCQNKNTTQNPLAPPTFHRLPKIRFSVRRIWKPNFPFAGEKGKYRLPMRLQRFRLLISLFKNTNPLLSLNHTLSWFSVRESKKEPFRFSFLRGFLVLYFEIFPSFKFFQHSSKRKQKSQHLKSAQVRDKTYHF